MNVQTFSYPHDLGPMNLIQIWTKAYDTRKAIEDSLPLIGQHTMVLSIQNGFCNLEKIAEVAGKKRVIGGITAHGVSPVSPDRQLRKELGPVIKELAKQKESEVVEGELVVGHVHMLISIPPKYAVAQVIGFIKGKSAIYVARMFGRRRNFVGQSFWARGYCASTTGLDEEAIREYIRSQEEADRKLEQMRLFEK